MPQPVLKLSPIPGLQTREKIQPTLVVPSVAQPAKRDNAKGVIAPAETAINHMGGIATLHPTNDTPLVPDLLPLGTTSLQDDTIAAAIP